MTGQRRAIDVAQLNDRVFVNNSSIGLYPHVVRHRDQMCERLGHGKWYAMLVAIIVMFRRFPVVNIRMAVNGVDLLTTAPFVFIGNNEYAVEGMEIGRRATLENGNLSLYFANRTGRLGMLRLALRALIGRLRQDRDFEATRTIELWIDSPKHELNVAIDGEVIRLSPPLHYRIRPKALQVMTPAGTY
jgi:diacylglycerol kinase family enzyme